MLLTVIGGDGVQAAKADQSTAASTGIECEAQFVAMSDAVHRRDPGEIAVARGALLEALGGDMNKLIDSVCIMAFFNGIADRTADATGLQVESKRAQTSIRIAEKRAGCCRPRRRRSFRAGAPPSPSPGSHLAPSTRKPWKRRRR